MKTPEEARTYQQQRRHNPETRPKVLMADKSHYIRDRDRRRQLRVEAEIAYQKEHGKR